MNIDALDYIVNNEVEIIEDSAKSAGVKAGSAVGVSKQVVAEKTDKNLSDDQRFVFERAVRPLIEGLTCNRKMHDDNETILCGARLPDSQLYDYYAHDETYCENCRSDLDYQAYRWDKIKDE